MTHVTGTGQILGRTHDPKDCEGRSCVIHNPSDHHMSDWPTHWREDRGIMERICEHGIGHPDPDDSAARKALGSFEHDGGDTHGCDGCCAERWFHLPQVLAENFGVSRSEARRLVVTGGVEIDGETVPEGSHDLKWSEIHGKEVKLGKTRIKTVRLSKG